MRIRGMACLVLVALLGCHSESEKRSDQDKTAAVEHVETCGEVVDRAVRLASGISIRGRRGEWGFMLKLAYRGRECDLRVERDASLWGFAAHPGVVLVVDRYASNEDRLMVFDMVEDNPARNVFEHDKGTTYTHSHYNVEAVGSGGIYVIEREWAGEDPDQHRRLLLRKGSAGWNLEASKNQDS